MRCITQSKFAVLSHVLPLSDSGQAVMLYRLLENIDKDNYIFILTSHNAGQSSGKGVQAKSSKKLGGKYYLLEGLDKPSLIARFFLNIPIFHGLALFALIIKKQEKQIKEILLEEKCKTIVLCTGGFFDIFSTFLVLKQLKIKLVIYSFDDFIYQWTGVLRLFVLSVAKKIFKRADKIIVPNEYLQKSYLDRFGRKSVIIRNPYLSLEAKGAKHVFNKNEINIVYTGSVYFAHFDAFKNLIKAIGLVKMPIKLHIFSAQQRKDLENAGVSGKNIEFHKSVDQGRVAAIQRSADILFLPLAFNCPIREVIRTSAPGKIGEYLASGRPILVHAPKDSFISWYFKSRKCGFVVDEPDPKALADAIRQLLNNKILEKDITNEAKKCLQDFSIDKARSNFLSAIYK